MGDDSFMRLFPAVVIRLNRQNTCPGALPKEEKRGVEEKKVIV